MSFFRLLFLIYVQTYVVLSQKKPPSLNADAQNLIFKHILSGEALAFLTNSSEFVPYNPKIRPTIDETIDNLFFDEEHGALEITTTVSFKQIISLDEKNQILVSSFYLLLGWGDPRLRWASKRYKNVQSITVPANNFWLPDLAIMNSASPGLNFIQYSPNQNLIIFSDGSCFLTLSLPNQQTRCRLNVYKYPFDTQTCSIILGSWLNSLYEINFDIDFMDKVYFDTQSYVKNPIWELKLLNLSTQIDESRFEIFNNLYEEDRISKDISFQIVIKRNPLYIMINGIFPCLVLNCVILIAYALPFSSQVGLCMTSFLTFSVTSLRVASDIPLQSEYLPLITLYFLLSILYTFIGLSWFIILESYIKNKKLPFVLEKIGLFLRKRLICCLFENEKKKENKIKDTKGENGEEMNKFRNLKCNFCNRCEECEKEYQKEKKKKNDQKELEKNASAINYLVFLFEFLLILSCNAAIWFRIGID